MSKYTWLSQFKDKGKCGAGGDDPMKEDTCFQMDERGLPCTDCFYYREGKPKYELKRLNRYNGDPLAKDQFGEFWFFDETWTDACGPFKTYEEAEVAVREYADSL